MSFKFKCYKVDSQFKTTTIYATVDGKVVGESKLICDSGLKRAERIEIHNNFLKENGFVIK